MPSVGRREGRGDTLWTGSEEGTGEPELMPGGDPGPAPQAGTHGLQILNAQKEDAGQYTCVVTNELGEAMKNYHVEVLSESRPWGTGRVGSQTSGALAPGPHWAPRAPLCDLSPLTVSRQLGQLGQSPF